MRLIVGLGNPGKKYEQTRHNIGFLVIDELAKQLNVEVNQNKFNALIVQTRIGTEKVLLMKPQTFMNLSGEAVIQAMNFYQIDPEELLVIYDDLDLPSGKLRLREKGSAGGHNGIKNIIQHLHTQEFNRIRIGVGKNPLIDTKDYVLGKIPAEEKKLFIEVTEEAAKACIDSVKMPFVDVMSKYNHK